MPVTKNDILYKKEYYTSLVEVVAVEIILRQTLDAYCHDFHHFHTHQNQQATIYIILKHIDRFRQSFKYQTTSERRYQVRL